MRPSRSSMLIFSMLPSAALTLLASRAIRPRWCSSSTRSSTLNSPVTSLAHESWMHFSGLWRISLMLRQLSRCTTMPLPADRWPTIGSPGIGVQHLA
ncbi:hypothetical protein D3C86_1505920 [compost metagenome]